jgi:fused signal recognition particle receptor
MFKNLRDRLGGFKGKLSKKVEEELESVPEEELEKESSAPVEEPVEDIPDFTIPEPPFQEPPQPPTSPADRKARRAARAERRAKRKEPRAKAEKKQPSKAKRAPKAAPKGPDAFTDSIVGRMIKERKFDDLLDDLETILLESDVALPVAEAIKEMLKQELVGRRVKRGVDMDAFVEESLRAAIRKVLAVEPVDLDAYIDSHERPVVLMFVGVNGTGKTTAIARIAHRCKRRGLSCVLAAGDTFRAGAIEQLTIHADRLGIKIIKHKAGSDPAAVAYDAVEHARARHKDVVLIDTAGRMQTNVNLMDEMKKIKRISQPHLIIFVGDALAGNDAVEQARKFDEAVGIDITILTKIDADAKGGAALSIAHAVGRPIAFVGTGQDYEDLEVFDPDWMVERLFA